MEKKSTCPICERKWNSHFTHYCPIIRVILVGLFLLSAWLAGGLFALIAIAIGWWPILKNALKSLLKKSLNVDVLVSLAVLASLLVGAFKEAATVIFIMLLGEFLESFTKSKTRSAIKKLMELAPKIARVRRNGKVIEIPQEKVIVGDTVLVKAGEQVPVDGNLLSSEASLDESAITGESKPVSKKKGGKILAGSISDGSYFEIKATKVGKDTTLAKIKKLVEVAQAQKAPIQRLADRFAKYFVPVVLILAGLIWLITLDITRTITILIVACPCALIIATPVAAVAAIGRGAKRGILIKGGEFLEKLGKIDTVIFDKTGTLTYGRPQVIHIKRFRNHSKKEIIRLAATIEQKSEHFLAKAILKKAHELNVTLEEPKDIKIIKGKGIIGTYNNRTIYLGNLSLMKENDIKVPEKIFSYIKKEEAKGHTVMITAHEREACGVICATDETRAEAKRTIEDLRKIGIKNIWMITGDNEIVALNIAKDLGIKKIFSEMLPQDKIDQIKKLQKQDEKVIMIGDGINDAPALVQADVGIAMGSGTDIALESGSIALMKNDLTKIPEAIRLGRKAVAVIKQNITFAFGFNLLMFILASFAVINMIGGAVFHQISSLVVILNAMRLLITH